MGCPRRRRPCNVFSNGEGVQRGSSAELGGAIDQEREDGTASAARRFLQAGAKDGRGGEEPEA